MMIAILRPIIMTLAVHRARRRVDAGHLVGIEVVLPTRPFLNEISSLVARPTP
jgi:hypothetical protein